MDDDVTRALEQLSGNVPEARTALTELEKDAIVARVGPLTTRNILLAKKDYRLPRIPFLFSAVDTQDVVDILANDMELALKRAAN